MSDTIIEKESGPRDGPRGGRRPKHEGDDAGAPSTGRPASNKKGCRFMNEDGKCEVDYKNVRLLQKLVTPQGKIYSRKRSGACAQCQKQIKIAIKRARFMALISVVGR
ncbi:MAG: 30S ribosomal protein S18 [Planctomycetota bacterium]